MGYTIKQIANALGADVLGNADLVVEGVSEPADASREHLAMAMKPKFAEDLPKGAARAAFLWDGADWQGMGLEAAIVAHRPRYLMSGLTAFLDPGQGWDEGIHSTAVIHDTAQLGEGVTVGPLAVIGAGAVVGAHSVIGPQSYVGTEATLGEDCFLREGVKIGSRCVIGNRFIAQPGVAVGGDGFSYVTPEKSAVEQVRKTLGDRGEAAAQSWTRIHSLGAVEIGDDVEMGANSTVDKGTIRNTRIGSGTKIDNLVMIGHNVEVGTDCLFCSMVGISGSTKIGKNVVLAGQTGVNDNIFIGDNVVTGGATKVFSNIPAGRVMLGHPAMKMETTMEVFKGLRRLKRLYDDVAELKKTVLNQKQSD
ncbi:UDP-3-O-acylglucosamine N-acyltransferase [Roseovarius albus]|uniref:UDP-3-O-acylglucosamine N-acyltransferase n=1 Tax=Roseovarius albus TaxID=1247867 RepID=A0A1X6YZM5_9RHOB|nr:UDP-3-O-(3-hydroxymyristoyl)glucosamine N-acyltransferase [Roseovarius albus]SLN36014.1 UDP-3-O-acylglucosamine N-acyltransferase [Roseovarius albus]